MAAVRHYRHRLRHHHLSLHHTGKPVAIAERREGGNSEVSKRDGVAGKPVAVAEGREGGLIKLDLTEWDFIKADCRTRCRK